MQLGKYVGRSVIVKFTFGRQVTGVLKGCDQLLNLVLDDTVETIRRPDEPERTRTLGLVVARGHNVLLVAPADGTEEIPNPFAMPEQ